MLKQLLILFLYLNLTACGTMWKNSQPERTGLEQILLATAAERSASQFSTGIKKNNQSIENMVTHLGKTFLSTENFQSYDKKYALHTIRRYLLDAGISLVDSKKQADTIIEVAAAALSIDTTNFLLGIPQMNVPIPLAGSVTIPEIQLYKKEKNRSIAKFSVSFRDAKTGKLKGHSFVTLGTAEVTNWVVLLFFKFVSNDLAMPETYDQLYD